MTENIEFSNELNEVTAKWVSSEGKVHLYGVGEDTHVVEAESSERAEEIYWNFVYQFEQGHHGH